MSKLINVHFDTSMSLGHPGLYQLAKQTKSDGYSVFINKSWTALKMITPSNVVLHYKSPSYNQRINMETIKYLPACVEGGTLDYSKALELAVTKQYEKWAKRRGVKVPTKDIPESRSPLQ